ncbi:uncharacterized protein MAM_02442 [Metarhizium album ARSEF 1941]|uniref:Tat pathway signal sequence n=1 Tax=Metarhizium album (strain ARSEF 1941) TaxID=1081103 RepID=A0A0B2X130_METAS|nr:uncharacterized protein MAM_02442 [Metarhizium album ARSEF 1941]KHN99589.1 hypothetical protein MAM_02442 [Metarhizium album ARSEF 1941]
MFDRRHDIIAAFLFFALARSSTAAMDKYSDQRSSTANDSDVHPVSLEKEGLLDENSLRASESPKMPSCTRVYLALAAVLAVANLILGALLVVQFRSSQAKATPHSHRHHDNAKRPTPPPIPLGGLPQVNSHPDWLPPEEWRTEVFRLHEIYGEEPVGTAKEAWLSLIPKGKGFIVVKNDTELPSMPGLRHPEHEQHACVAIFHQLHCLVRGPRPDRSLLTPARLQGSHRRGPGADTHPQYITYAAYWNARAGNFDDIPPEHLIHCWDYLRQSIMCAGDTSLEWVHRLDKPPGQTSGWGYQHTCKNFDAIFDWTESHRYTEKIEID